MKKVLVYIAIALVFITSVFAQSQEQMMAPIPLDPAIRTGVLPNGLTYYIMANQKPEKQAEFYIFHNVGAIQEEDSQQGLAHFLEHMAFNGTKNLPDKMLINYLESIGVKFGANLNAGTGQGTTIYNISSVPVTRQGIIDTAMLILHDWSYFVSLKGEEIDKERGVIVEELRTRQTADWRTMEKSFDYLFRGSKYADRNIIGYIDGLRSFSHQELVDFYHRWYRTDLQAIMIVGDIDVDAIEAKVKTLMADIPAVENPEPKGVYEIPDNEQPIIGILTDPETTSSSIEMYIKHKPLPLQFNNTMIAQKLDYLKSFISTMANNRLEEIAQKPNAPFINANIFNGGLVATMDAFGAVAEAREGEISTAFEAVYKEVEKIRRYGFNPSELERVKSDMMRSAQRQYDNRNDRRSNQLVRRMLNVYRKNTPMPTPELEWQLDSTLIATTTLEEVNAVAKQLITASNRVILAVSPEKAGLAIPTEAEIAAIMTAVDGSELESYADNSVKEPLIPEGTVLKASAVKHSTTDIYGSTVWTLKNGVKVVVMPTTFKADEIMLSANSLGGTSVLNDDEVAVANVLPQIAAMSGLGKFNAIDLQKQLAGKAASTKLVVNNYSNAVAAAASPKDLETMFQLIWLTFNAPRFDQTDFDVMKDRYSAMFLNASSDPSFIFGDSLTSVIFNHSPRRQQLSYERINNITFDKVEKVYRKLYGSPDDFTYTIVGNVDMATLKPLVEKYLGSMPKTKEEYTWCSDNVEIVKGRNDFSFAAKMQMPKSSVAYTISGPLDNTLDNRLAFSALTQILRIRYTELVREEKGGTYGVSVGGSIGMLPYQRYIMQIEFDTDPAMAEELMTIITDELDNIAKNGPRDEDIAKIKEFMNKQYKDNLQQNSSWLDWIGTYHIYNLDHMNGYERAVEALNGARIKALTAKIIADGNITSLRMYPAE